MGRNRGIVEVGGAYPEVTIHPFNWTERQQIFIDLVLDDKNQLMFCSSPAGTGKTLLSAYCSLKLLIDKKIDKIIYVRNPVESCSGRGLGFIKGDTGEKLEPYIAPLHDNLNKLLDSHSLNIVDEAEDFSFQDLRLILTRLGKKSKMLIIGDDKQANLKEGKFSLMIDIFNNPEARSKGVQTFKFGAK